MSELDLKLKIQAQNTATPALTELLNSIKALIEQARILNTLLHLNLNVTNNSGNLGAELRSLEQQAQQLQNHLNLHINAQNNAGGALNSATQSTQALGTAAHGAADGVRSLEQHAEVLQTRLNQFIALQVAQVVTGWGKSLVHTTEAYQTNSAKLQLAIKDTQEFNSAHQQLFDIAQRSRGSLDQTTNAFIRNSESIKRMGGTTEQALLATELLNKAIAATSMGAAQDASALMQWNQALGKGILNGDELNSIMENSLGLTKAIADGMGIPIGKLKELGEQGKLTGTDLVNALFANRDAIEQNFNAIPVTISQSLTAVENSFQQYIGQANEASGATQGIAKTIMGVAKNIPEIVSALTSLAAIYGVKLTGSLVAYIAQMRIQSAANAEAITEAERLYYVRIQELTTQRAIAAASVTAARSKMAEARLDAALATTVADRTIANEALAISIAEVTAAEERYIGTTAALGAATTEATVKLTALEVVANGLKMAFCVLFAAWAGWEVGTLLRKYEVVRNAGSLLVEGFVIQMETARHFFSGDFLTGKQGLADKIKAIHKDFADSRAADSEDAQQAAEQSKARSEAEIERVKQEKIARQEAFKETIAKLKETGAAMDAETTRQNQVLKTTLEQSKADIAGSVGSALEKELLITQAVKASQDAQMLIIQEAGNRKLAIVDKTYNQQLKTLQAGTVEQAAVEKESMTARLEVYQGLEKSYGGMVDGLIAEEQRLAKEADTLANKRKGIEQSYEDFKLQLKQSSMSKSRQLDDDKNRLDKLVADKKKADAIGDAKESERLNSQILELGKKLATSEQAMVNSHKQANDRFVKTGANLSKTYFGEVDAIVRITDKAQAELLATNQTVQNANKDILADVKNTAVDAATALGNVQQQIANIIQALQNRFLLKIDPDTQAAYDAIAKITQPLRTTLTVDVIENHVQAKAGGGYISGTSKGLNSSGGSSNPGLYATGGEVFERKQGAISGKGSGTSDEIPAMLSNGEYVITADKVNQYGKGVFDAINYGSQPVAIAHYANGGAVGGDRKNKIIEDIKAKQFEDFEAFANLTFTQLTWAGHITPTLYMSPTTKGQAESNFAGNAQKYLRDNKLPMEFLPRYMSRVKAAKVATDTSRSLDDRAEAQMAIEDTVSSPGQTPTQSTRLDSVVIPAQPASVAPPVLPPPVLSSATSFPVIPPPTFSSYASSSQSSMQTGKVSTVKFENQNGDKVIAHSQDPNLDKFFDELNTVSRVSKI